jgi:hypothetical protein
MAKRSEIRLSKPERQELRRVLQSGLQPVRTVPRALALRRPAYRLGGGLLSGPASRAYLGTEIETRYAHLARAQLGVSQNASEFPDEQVRDLSGLNTLGGMLKTARETGIVTEGKQVLDNEPRDTGQNLWVCYTVRANSYHAAAQFVAYFEHQLPP